MSETLKDLIDQVWQSSDALSSASSITQRMSAEQKESLKIVLLELLKNANSDSQTFSENQKLGSAFTTSNSEEEEFASILLLLMFAFHHSDGLLFLPPDLRQSRIRSWSEQTGLKEVVVREALRLGPERLAGFL